jgi:hypothetical protein
VTKSTGARFMPECKLEAAQMKDGEEYGWPRIWNGLLARGIRVGKDGVLQIQRSWLAARERRAA